MESNISRDHIALEAMKIIIEKSYVREQTIWNKIAMLFGFGHSSTDSFLKSVFVARKAYDYADAMIAERERKEESVNAS